MPLLKENKELTCLGQSDNIITYVRIGEYNSIGDDSNYEVLTYICFKDLKGNKVYEFSCYPFICAYKENKNTFNYESIEIDLLTYVNYCNIEKYWKNIVITSLLNNEYRGMNTIKNFVREYYQIIENNIKKENNNKLLKIEKTLESEVSELIKEVSKKELTKLHQPKDALIYEVCTKYTKKIFNRSPFPSENILNLNAIVEHLKEYINYINSDFDPVEFMNFDLVINN